MLRQIILDTETTGLDPKSGHRVIEIGCIELINRNLLENNSMFILILTEIVTRPRWRCMA